jgi:formate dehydrogenase beta subunit
MPMDRKEFLKLAALGLGGALLWPETAAADEPEVPASAGDYVCKLYDTTLCIGCRACQTACRQWNNTQPEPDASGLYDAPKDLSADTWMLIQLYQGGDEWSFVKHQCMHCVHPACVSACPVSALQKQENGAVVYDKKRCIGCRYCMVACPFNVPRFAWSEVIPVIAKCTLCNDRLAAGNGPFCAESCPTGALIWGRRDDMIAEAERRLREHPERYVNHIYGKDDIGGTSVIYLSHVDFSKLGFPEVDTEAVTELSETTGSYVLPGLLVGVPLFLTAVRISTRKKES